MTKAAGRGGTALAVLLTASNGAADDGDEAQRSVPAPLAGQSLLLDIVGVDGLHAAVGERGHVLLSDDDGASWRQIVVPTRATLTGVYFLDRRLGWAVGHDAVILRTEDGGESWQRVHHDPGAHRPLLDVRFRDERRGYAVGAYGYFLVSDDGGRSWRERELTALRLDGAVGAEEAAAGDGRDDEEWYALDEYDFSEGITVHLNRVVAGRDGRLYMAAEAGALFRSDDGGENWLSLDAPYDGSFFGLLPLADEALLAFGLRGHLFRSDDAGASWRALDSGSEAMLTDAVRLSDGRIVLTGLAGTVLVSEDGGHAFTLHQRPDRYGLQALVPAADGLLAVGEQGVHRLDPVLPDTGIRP